MKSKIQPKVIYLSGTSAVGKSTITKELNAQIPNLLTFIYGEELTKYIANKTSSDISSEKIRMNFSEIITNEDITNIDNQLIKFINDNRKNCNILIDSHAVIREFYGFRVHPLSISKIQLIKPDYIIVLYAEPNVILNRISIKPEGRPLITEFESQFSTNLQAAVCLLYSIQFDIPIFYIDSNKPINELLGTIKKCINK